MSWRYRPLSLLGILLLLTSSCVPAAAGNEAVARSSVTATWQILHAAFHKYGISPYPDFIAGQSASPTAGAAAAAGTRHPAAAAPGDSSRLQCSLPGVCSQQDAASSTLQPGHIPSAAVVADPLQPSHHPHQQQQQDGTQPFNQPMPAQPAAPAAADATQDITASSHPPPQAVLPAAAHTSNAAAASLTHTTTDSPAATPQPAAVPAPASAAAAAAATPSRPSRPSPVRRLLNLAELSDGASVVAANPEARRPERAIDRDIDSFMKNDCDADKWMIIELSQLGTVETVKLTMKELYSSRVHTFRVLGRSSHPRKDGPDLTAGLASGAWQLLGSFTAENKRGTQSFSLPQRSRVRYLLLMFDTHYGNEQMCAMNWIEVLGVSAAQELEEALALQDLEAEHEDHHQQQQQQQHQQQQHGAQHHGDQQQQQQALQQGERGVPQQQQVPAAQQQQGQQQGSPQQLQEQQEPPGAQQQQGLPISQPAPTTQQLPEQSQQQQQQQESYRGQAQPPGQVQSQPSPPAAGVAGAGAGSAAHGVPAGGAAAAAPSSQPDACDQPQQQRQQQGEGRPAPAQQQQGTAESAQQAGMQHSRQLAEEGRDHVSGSGQQQVGAAAAAAAAPEPTTQAQAQQQGHAVSDSAPGQLMVPALAAQTQAAAAATGSSSASPAPQEASSQGGTPSAPAASSSSSSSQGATDPAVAAAPAAQQAVAGQGLQQQQQQPGPSAQAEPSAAARQQQQQAPSADAAALVPVGSEVPPQAAVAAPPAQDAAAAANGAPAPSGAAPAAHQQQQQAIPLNASPTSSSQAQHAPPQQQQQQQASPTGQANGSGGGSNGAQPSPQQQQQQQARASGSVLDSRGSNKPKQAGNLFDVVKSEMMQLKLDQGKLSKKVDALTKRSSDFEAAVAAVQQQQLALSNQVERLVKKLDALAGSQAAATAAQQQLRKDVSALLAAQKEQRRGGARPHVHAPPAGARAGFGQRHDPGVVPDVHAGVPVQPGSSLVDAAGRPLGPPVCARVPGDEPQLLLQPKYQWSVVTALAGTSLLGLWLVLHPKSLGIPQVLRLVVCVLALLNGILAVLLGLWLLVMQGLAASQQQVLLATPDPRLSVPVYRMLSNGSAWGDAPL